MKRYLLITALLATIALPAIAQTNAPPATNAPPPAATNTISLRQFAGDIYNFTLGDGLTNLHVAFIETYTPSLKKWGSAVVVGRNLAIGDTGLSAGLSVGVDAYDKNFYALNGQISLQADITPLSTLGSWGTNIVLSPVAYMGSGTPFGGQSSGASAVEFVTAGGFGLHIVTIPGIKADFKLVGLYGNRQGLGAASGVFWGGGGDFSWKF